MIGETIGRWSVVDDAGMLGGKNRYYKCVCQCGEIRNVSRCSLIKGKTKSCGCLSKELTRLRSKSNNIMISINGISRTLSEWCLIVNIPYTRAYMRIKKLGWDAVRAITGTSTDVKGSIAKDESTYNQQ